MAAQAVTSSALSRAGVSSRGYLYTYLIPTAAGYILAFVINRKVTLKADSNPARSIFLDVILMASTIAASSWAGAAITAFAAKHHFIGNALDLVIKIICMAMPSGLTPATALLYTEKESLLKSGQKCPRPAIQRRPFKI